MTRSAVAISLPPAELAAVSAQLTEAGYEPIEVRSIEDLEDLLNGLVYELYFPESIQSKGLGVFALASKR